MRSVAEPRVALRRAAGRERSAFEAALEARSGIRRRERELRARRGDGGARCGGDRGLGRRSVDSELDRCLGGQSCAVRRGARDGRPGRVGGVGPRVAARRGRDRRMRIGDVPADGDVASVPAVRAERAGHVRDDRRRAGVVVERRRGGGGQAGPVGARAGHRRAGGVGAGVDHSRRAGRDVRHGVSAAERDGDRLRVPARGSGRRSGCRRHDRAGLVDLDGDGLRRGEPDCVRRGATDVGARGLRAERDRVATRRRGDRRLGVDNTPAHTHVARVPACRPRRSTERRA